MKGQSMPQLQNLVLQDRTAPTPVVFTYVPRDIVDGVGTVVSPSVSGIPLADKRVTVSLKRTSNGNYKPRISIALPVVADQNVNGVIRPVIIRTAHADLTFNFASDSTEQERKDMLGHLSAALLDTRVLTHDTIVKLQAVY